MSKNSKLPRLTAPLRLSDPTANRLSELAVEWDLTLHDAMQAAIHHAYLDMLHRKSNDAANELHSLMGRRVSDDELPF
ncbi:MAG: hypothetical protein NXH97_12460 [Rhodobacteraceae bacterium]|nr:hypothetical protein [Paracoccaceae bacterium]